MERIGVITTFINKRSKGFWGLLFKNPFFIMLASIFILGKLITNLIMGASLFNALRSSIIGFIFYTIGCYLIHFLSEPNPDSESQNITGIHGNFYSLLVWYIFIVLILTLQIMNRNNIFNLKIPLWSQINHSWTGFAENLAGSLNTNAAGLLGWPYLILYLLVPLILLKKRSFLFSKFFSLKTGYAALPFLGMYVIAFIVTKGISVPSLAALIFVIIWPALGEEFFFRGIMQKMLTEIINNPVTAIVLTSVLFTASHIPAYIFSYSSGPAAAFSSLLPVMFTSFFWGYGYYRTGILWPWIMIHALSDIVGF